MDRKITTAGQLPRPKKLWTNSSRVSDREKYFLHDVFHHNCISLKYVNTCIWWIVWFFEMRILSRSLIIGWSCEVCHGNGSYLTDFFIENFAFESLFYSVSIVRKNRFEWLRRRFNRDITDKLKRCEVLIDVYRTNDVSSLTKES